MTADSKDPKTEATPEGKKGGMMGLVALGVVALGSAFGVSYFTGSAESAPETCVADEDAAHAAKAPVRKDKTFVELEEILITIGSEPATRYLKMDVSIVTDKEHASAVEKDAPLLMDAFINYLRSVELEDFEDPTHYAQMREQLARRSELVLGASASDGVLVTSFLLR